MPIGAMESELVNELVLEFPRALIERNDEELCNVATVIAKAARGQEDPTQLPLDIKGTAFQMQVWKSCSQSAR